MSLKTENEENRRILLEQHCLWLIWNSVARTYDNTLKDIIQYIPYFGYTVDYVDWKNDSRLSRKKCRVIILYRRCWKWDKQQLPPH